MKTVFIINPMAGKKKNIEKISELIRQLSENTVKKLKSISQNVSEMQEDL